MNDSGFSPVFIQVPLCGVPGVYYTNMTSLCGVQQSSRGGVIPVVHHTGMSYLFYYNQTTYKTQKGKNDKHKKFWILFCKKITNYNNRDVQLLHWRIRVQQKPQYVQQEEIFSLTQKIFWKHEQMSLIDVSLPFSNKICIRKRLNSIYWYHLLINLGAYLLARH